MIGLLICCFFLLIGSVALVFAGLWLLGILGLITGVMCFWMWNSDRKNQIILKEQEELIEAALADWAEQQNE